MVRSPSTAAFLSPQSAKARRNASICSPRAALPGRLDQLEGPLARPAPHPLSLLQAAEDALELVLGDAQARLQFRLFGVEGGVFAVFLRQEPQHALLQRAPGGGLADARLRPASLCLPAALHLGEEELPERLGAAPPDLPELGGTPDLL